LAEINPKSAFEVDRSTNGRFSRNVSLRQEAIGTIGSGQLF
jgi:hypothetical protein